MPLFTPIITALSPYRSYGIGTRLRLISLQLLTFIIVPLTKIHLLLRGNPYKVRHAISRGGEKIRYLIYYPPNYTPDAKVNLHMCIHSGGFVMGSPESTVDFCQHVARELNAVVVSPAYRFAPKHPFPAAPNDVADVLRVLLEATPALDVAAVTVSGFSAGAALALGLSLNYNLGKRVQAAVTFYAPTNMRIPRASKPAPKGMKFDPFLWLGPLFDTYEPLRGNWLWTDDRIAPGAVQDLDRLPPKVMLVAAGIDVLLNEQLKLAERLGDRAELVVYKDRYHGWLEFPGNTSEKQEVFKKATNFLKDAITTN